MTRALLLALGSLLALGLAEGVCRLAGVAPPYFAIQISANHTSPDLRFQLSENPRLFYEPVPGSGEINRAGYRGPLLRPDPGKRRIVLIGDSVTFGVAVEHRQSFASRLAQGWPGAQIINLAVPGYNLPQYVEVLSSHALEHAPDHVVFLLCLNDLEVDSLELKRLMQRVKEAEDAGLTAREYIESHYRSPTFFAKSVLMRSALFRFVWHRVWRSGAMNGGAGSDRASHPRDDVHFAAAAIDSPQALDAHLARIHALAADDGFGVSFVLLPGGRGNPKVWKRAPELIASLERTRTPYWNLHEELYTDLPRSAIRRLFLDALHYSDEGHEEVARRLLEGREHWLPDE